MAFAIFRWSPANTREGFGSGDAGDLREAFPITRQIVTGVLAYCKNFGRIPGGSWHDELVLGNIRNN